MMHTTTLLHINQFFTFCSINTLFENIYCFLILFCYITRFSISYSFPDKYKTRGLHTFVSIAVVHQRCTTWLPWLLTDGWVVRVIEENLLTYQHNSTVIASERGIYCARFHNFTIHVLDFPVYIHPSYYALSISTLFYSVYLKEERTLIISYLFL